MDIKKLGLAAIAVSCLWAAVPASAQYWPSPIWRVDKFTNGAHLYYCNGTDLWAIPQGQQPGTLLSVTEDPSACY